MWSRSFTEVDGTCELASVVVDLRKDISSAVQICPSQEFLADATCKRDRGEVEGKERSWQMRKCASEME